MASTKIDDTLPTPLGPVAYQFAFGSSYIPNGPARAPTASALAPQLFSYAQSAFKKYDQGMIAVANNVTFKDFKTDSWVFGVDLERTSMQSLSGIPLSNSRALSIVADFEDNAQNIQQNTNFFLEYVSVVRVYSSNASIEV
jgi:hypothetical protein